MAKVADAPLSVCPSDLKNHFPMLGNGFQSRPVAAALRIVDVSRLRANAVDLYDTEPLACFQCLQTFALEIKPAIVKPLYLISYTVESCNHPVVYQVGTVEELRTFCVIANDT